MHDGNDEATMIMGVAIGAGDDGWRPVLMLAAVAGIVCAVVFEAWILLLPALLVLYAGALMRHCLMPPGDAAAQGIRNPVTDQAHVPASASTPRYDAIQKRQARMGHLVDQFLNRHPHSSKARLAKASMLWHFYGDRDGARCHCREILARIQREDPLFEQVCDLYMQTCASTASRSVSPSHHPAADGELCAWAAGLGVKQAKIIPFPSKRPPQLARNRKRPRNGAV
jgi:hypothetical protein